VRKVLFVAFLVMPLLELWAITRVADAIDWLPTIALLLIVSVVGAWMVRAQGFSLLRRFNEDLNKGRVPANALIDGALVVLGGSLLLTPGFITDALGLALQLPPFRALLRPLLTQQVQRRVKVRSAGMGSMFGGGPAGPGGAGPAGGSSFGGAGSGESPFGGSPFGGSPFGTRGPGSGPSGDNPFGPGFGTPRRPGSGDYIDAEVVSEETVGDDASDDQAADGGADEGGEPKPPPEVGPGRY